MTAETVVCRCEDVTRAEIEETLEAGAFEVNQLKSWTRCGMGPCQGRMCGDAAARLVAARVGGREAAGVWTARVPIRPVPMEFLIGDYEYEDIPKPPPAPR
jgi:bacterioferritin-associated ferredoxin